MTYRNWLDNWLKHYIQPNTKQRTYVRYEQLVRIHIMPHIGDMNIENITPAVLQKLVTILLDHGNGKLRQGLSASTVNTVISVAQNSLHTAYLFGYTADYTANKVKRPKPKERKIECFTIAEQKRIERAALESHKPKLFGIVLCLYTGLRIGELLALQWKDIDFAKGLLSVCRSCHDTTDGLVFDEPKTTTSRRIIPLPEQLLTRLKRIKKSSKSDFVVSEDGNAVLVRCYQRSFELLLKRLEITHRGFHSLRHTFATRALECGMDVRTLSEILGHKNPTVTLNRYAHPMLEHKTAMMNRLGKLL